MSSKYMFAISADAALTAALVRVYGRARVADMRYRPNEWTDEALIAAGITKRSADESHLAEMRANSIMKGSEHG